MLLFTPLSTAWRRMFFDRKAEFWLHELRPEWSLHERRARVVEVIDETADTKTFVLEAAAWPGHRAGQFVPITVEIDGTRVTRCYSITTLPNRRRLAIAVKRVPGGRMSNHLHDHVRRGAVVVLGEPAGDFTLPDRAPARIALIAGGSGITPVLAMLRDLRHRKSSADIVVLQAARTEADAAFAAELSACTTAKLRVIAHRDDAAGFLTKTSLVAAIPDLATREIYTCGPTALMDLVEAAAGKPVHRERFTAAPLPIAHGAKTRVHLAVANRTVEIDGHGTLLEQLERAGERPAHGCRMGICNTCRCTARGATSDLATGATSTEPDRSIRLCTSVATGADLELSL